jgi:hypothetical protein
MMFHLLYLFLLLQTTFSYVGTEDIHTEGGNCGVCQNFGKTPTNDVAQTP